MKNRKAGSHVILHSADVIFSNGILIVRNDRKCAVIAIAGAGLAVAAGTPASACTDWGYSGVYSYGWPYANTGFSSYPAYSYRSCGGHYSIPGWGECGGYGHCGWVPLPAVVLAAPVMDTAATVPGERRAADRAPRMRR
jgi:hypothetical protein